MKCAEQLVKMCCVLCFALLVLFSCKKNDETPEEPGGPPPVVPPVVTSGVINADTISNHLRFLAATKKTGIIPRGPSGSSLKISINDTLSLLDEIKRPVKFLHLDTLKNVLGVYLQITTTAQAPGSSKTAASYYYDVPELNETADNSTMSTILLGLDPNLLMDRLGNLPLASIEITIVPYGPGNVPLGQTIKPVKIKKSNSAPEASTCGLVLASGDFWDWDCTQIENPAGNGLLFYNAPDKIWGAGGQFIKGCCQNGQSFYDGVCAVSPDLQKSKIFRTRFSYDQEYIKFFSDGLFERFTKETHILPDPDKTNFCGVADGVVHQSNSEVLYFGSWSISKLSVPFRGDSLNLIMPTKSKTGGTGYGRSSGLIHQLDCETLVLIKPDNEGGARHEVSYFSHAKAGLAKWYEMTS